MAVISGCATKTPQAQSDLNAKPENTELFRGHWCQVASRGIQFLESAQYKTLAAAAIRGHFPSVNLDGYTVKGPYWRDEFNLTEERQEHVMIQMTKTTREGETFDVVNVYGVVMTRSGQPLAFSQNEQKEKISPKHGAPL